MIVREDSGTIQRVRILKRGSLELPDFECHVVSSRGQQSVFVAELYCRHKVVMGIEFLLFFAEVEVPDPDGLVIRGRVEVLPCRMESKTAYPVVVSDEGV